MKFISIFVLQSQLCLFITTIMMLSAQDINEKRISELDILLAGNDRIEFMKAREELKEYVGPNMLDYVNRLLLHDRWLVRKTAVECLRSQELENIESYVNKLFSKGDERFQAITLSLFCELKPEKALTIAKNTMSTKSSELLREAAAFVIAEMTDQELSKSDSKLHKKLLSFCFADESPRVQFAALERLREQTHYEEDFIQVLLQAGLKTLYEEVALQIGDLLVGQLTKEDFKWLEKKVYRAKGQACVNGILILLATQAPERKEAFLKLASHRDPEIKATAVESLGLLDPYDEEQEKDIVKVLVKALNDKALRVRACAAVSLCKRNYEKVDQLLLKLLKDDSSGVFEYLLEAITGREYDTIEEWVAWYAYDGQRYNRRPFNDNDPEAAYYFYGIPDDSKHVSFVIDTSGSMKQNSRLQEVKEELQSCIWDLPFDSRFNVVTFSSLAQVWQKSSLRSFWRNRIKWYEKGVTIIPSGRTNMEMAFDLALNIPQIESIYFLTDGMPTVGMVDTQLIDKTVTECNFDKEVYTRIHTLSFDLPQAVTFLTSVSNNNQGTFRMVKID